MLIKHTEIEAIVDDLTAKKDRLEQRKINDVPSHYMGAAVYNHVIEQLKGLIKSGK